MPSHDDRAVVHVRNGRRHIEGRVVEFNTGKRKYVISYDNEEDEDETVRFELAKMELLDDWDHVLSFKIEPPTLSIADKCEHFYQGRWWAAQVDDIDDEFITIHVDDGDEDRRVKFGCPSVRQVMTQEYIDGVKAKARRLHG